MASVGFDFSNLLKSVQKAFFRGGDKDSSPVPGTAAAMPPSGGGLTPVPLPAARVEGTSIWWYVGGGLAAAGVGVGIYYAVTAQKKGRKK